MKFYILGFFENLSRKFKFDHNIKRRTGTLHEDICTFIISCGYILRMRNVSDKSYRENQNTHFMFSDFSSKIHAVYEIMWKNMVGPDR